MEQYNVLKTMDFLTAIKQTRGTSKKIRLLNENGNLSTDYYYWAMGILMWGCAGYKIQEATIYDHLLSDKYVIEEE